MKNTHNYSCVKYIKKINRIDEDYINNIFIKLYEKYIKKPETIVLEVFDQKSGDEYLVDLALIAPDWPGILETISAYLHRSGYNLYMNYAFVFPCDNEQRSYLIYRLKMDEKGYAIYRKRKKYFKAILTNSALQSAPVNYLLSREIDKLEKFDSVYNLIRRKVEPRFVKDLLSDSGELIKFFTNRTKDYLSERNSEDLFDQVFHNYIFQKKLQKDPSLKFLYKVNNIKTTREFLSCVTLAGYNDKINLNMVLTALRKSVPGFLIRYIKKFSVNDLTVFRVEICDKNENYYSQDSIRRISNALETLRSQGYLLSLESFDSIGGYEQYARAIIPILRNEFKKTNIPQFYISLENKQEYFVEFKIITVFSSLGKELENFVIKFAKDLSVVNGFHIFKISPPSLYSNNELNMIDIRVESEKWKEGEDIYVEIKKILRNYIPLFRDFDEGMRLMDQRKLNYIMKNLPSYPKYIIMNFYYHLHEFYRISSFEEEILCIIRKSIELYYKILKKESNYQITTEQLTFMTPNKKVLTTGSVFYVAYKSHNEKMSEILSVLSEFELNFSRVDFENITILIAILKKTGKPLTAISFHQIKKALEKYIE